MDNSYFDFVIYLAFETLLEYGDKTSLSLKQLHDYRLNIFNSTDKYYSQYDSYDDSDFEALLKDYLKLNREMSSAQEEIRFAKFLKDNKDLFYLENGTIFLKEDITAEDFSELKFDLDCYTRHWHSKIICGGFIGATDSSEILDILGATKTKDDILKLYKIEKTIEEAYQNYEDETCQNTIRIGHALIGTKLRNIFLHSHHYINNYYRLLSRLMSENALDVDLNLISEELMESDKFYDNNSYIDDALDNRFQQAIFGDETLAWDKLESYLQLLEAKKRPLADGPLFEPANGDWDAFFEKFVDDDIDDYDDEFGDPSDNEVQFNEFEDGEDVEILKRETKMNFLFYLKYIETLNNYQNRFGTSDQLTRSKGRLLYLLDQYGYELYNEEKLNQFISNNTMMEKVNYKKDLYDFYVMSRLFIFDTLKKEETDEQTLRKILFISTYYDLTEDVRIKRIIKKYRNTDIGTKIYDAIIHHESNKFASFGSPSLVKRPINKPSTEDK